MSFWGGAAIGMVIGGPVGALVGGVAGAFLSPAAAPPDGPQARSATPQAASIQSVPVVNGAVREQDIYRAARRDRSYMRKIAPGVF